MNDKQRRFYDEYLIDRNATQAALRAGYSKKTSYAQGHRLLNLPAGKKYLAKKAQAITDRLDITAERTMQEIGRIAFADIRGLYTPEGKLKPMEQLTDAQAAVVAGVEVDELFEGYGKDRERVGENKKVKLWDKVRALEMLAKHFKIFEDGGESKVTVVIKKKSNVGS